MEHSLTATAIEHDPDFLARVARRWTDAIDQDGGEPSEEVLRQLQGAFIRKPRHGLHHLEIFATTEQFETLLTVMNTATNPRTTPGGTGSDGSPGAADSSGASKQAFPAIAGSHDETGAGDDAVPGGEAGAEGFVPGGLDWRSRPQKSLDGLVGGCKLALASGGLPATGGHRPQIMVTIDYRDLLERLQHATNTGTATDTDPGSPDTAMDAAGRTNGGAGQPGFAGTGIIGGSRAGFTGAGGRIPGTGAGPFGFSGAGALAFTGPVAAATIRKIACDAEIIPVLLGSEGRIMDIGRTSRIFPPHIRKAITARDQGCAFPACTMPATWCEAHHITYWSRGGTTSTENGVLLCSHHHHLIHKEQWTIQVRTGIPWFIPPPHLDPHQTPRRNHYFRC